MTTEQRKVELFHLRANQPVRVEPEQHIGDYDPRLVEFRADLIREESGEVDEAMAVGEIEDVAKELADLLYVVYGTGVALGIDLHSVFDEVHESNISKLGSQVVTDERGKVQKAEGYWEPDIEKVLSRQRGEFSQAQKQATPTHLQVD